MENSKSIGISMEENELVAAVVEVLRAKPGSTTREIRRAIGVDKVDKGLINSTLYSGRGLFRKDTEARPRWFLLSSESLPAVPKEAPTSPADVQDVALGLPAELLLVSPPLEGTPSSDASLETGEGVKRDDEPEEIEPLPTVRWAGPTRARVVRKVRCAAVDPESASSPLGASEDNQHSNEQSWRDDYPHVSEYGGEEYDGH